jgi:hypothetical protein
MNSTLRDGSCPAGITFANFSGRHGTDGESSVSQIGFKAQTCQVFNWKKILHDDQLKLDHTQSAREAQLDKAKMVQP